MKRQGFHHRKVRRLARELGRMGVTVGPRALARGMLEGLWYLAATEAPRGDIGRLTDEDIADALETDPLEPADVVAALVRAGWLDEHPEHRLLVHDWPEHADKHVHRALVRSLEHFADGTPPRLTEGTEREREAWLRTHGTPRAEGAAGGTAGDPMRPPDAGSGDPVRPPKPGIRGPHGVESQSQSQSQSQKKEEEGAGAPGPPAGGPSVREPPLARVWQRGLEAAGQYRSPPPRWKLTDAYRRPLKALVREEPERGDDVFAAVVHGYRAARAGWDQIEAHFSPKTLLRAANRAEYLEAYDQALAAGRRPPFRGQPPPRGEAGAQASANREAERTSASLRADRERHFRTLVAEGVPREEALKRARLRQPPASAGGATA